MRADQDELIRDSYYAASANDHTTYPPLDETVTVDACVVGGGFAGLSAAIELADRGYSVLLLEARSVGWGASGRNGGQIIAGLSCPQHVIERAAGHEVAQAVWKFTLEALDLVRQRAQRFAINCDLSAGFLGVAVGRRKGRALRAWYDDMAARYGYDADSQWIDASELPRWIDSPRFACAYHDRRSGHLHPLNYAMGLARGAATLGVRLCEQTTVHSMQRGETVTLATNRGTVRARHVLLAGNTELPEMAPGLAPGLARRIMPVGTYMIASEPLDAALIARLNPSRSAICDSNFVLDYFRFSADRRLLFGGKVSYSGLTPRHLKADLQRRMARVFPQLSGCRVDYCWGGNVDITMNRAPDFGRIAPNVYYLQGFSGHGVALAAVAGKLAAEAVHGQAERLDLMARIPHHDFPGGRLLRTPVLMLGMLWYQLRDLLG